jgi:hypothetical protein
MGDAIGGAPVGVVKAGARYRLGDMPKSKSQPRIEVAVELRLQPDRLDAAGTEKIKAQPKLVRIFLVVAIKRVDAGARFRQRILLARYAPGEKCRQTIQRFGENGRVDLLLAGVQPASAAIILIEAPSRPTRSNTRRAASMIT